MPTFHFNDESANFESGLSQIEIFQSKTGGNIKDVLFSDIKCQWIIKYETSVNQKITLLGWIRELKFHNP